jgi:hypothetical protein
MRRGTNLAFRWGNGAERFEVIVVSAPRAEEIHDLKVAEESGVRFLAVYTYTSAHKKGKQNNNNNNNNNPSVQKTQETTKGKHKKQGKEEEQQDGA